MKIGSMRQRFWFYPFFSKNSFSINKLANHFGRFSGFSKFSFFNKIENQPEGSPESLCDNSLKTKNVVRPNSSSVRADHCGI